MEYIIGVDTGTSGTKAIAFSPAGEMLGESGLAYSALQTEIPGRHELDPQVIFVAALTCINEVIRQCPEYTLKGIGLSSAMHGLMCVDENGTPLTGIITWADLRSATQASALLDSGHGQWLARTTGTPVHPMTPLCKLIWLRENEPAIFNKTHRFIGFKEYFLYRLSGKYLIDHSLASATGLFNIRERCWEKKALQLAGITEDKLPDAVPSDTKVYITSRDQFLEHPDQGSIPFIIGGSDGCLANLGSMATGDDELSLTIGTSGAVRKVISDPSLQGEGTFCYILDEQRYVTGGPINNGGILLKWFGGKFCERPIHSVADFSWFVEEAIKVKPGAEGLLFLPYVYGERAPVWDAGARGAFIGVHNLHGQTHFMRALLEGICFSLREVKNAVEQGFSNTSRIILSGGLSQSPQWISILADILGQPLIIRNTGDASSRGAAMVAIKAVMPHIDPEISWSTGEPEKLVNPDKKNIPLYDALFEVYKGLYANLKESFNKLNHILKTD